MTDPRHGVLNLKGVNCLRSLPGIGTVVFGGMLASTLLAMPFVPSFYIVMEDLDAWRRRRKASAPAQVEHAN